MATATGSLRRIVYTGEAEFKDGFKNETGTILRNTGDSLNLTKTSSQSAELTGDRAIRSLRLGNEAVAGDISFELAYGDFDDMLAAAMCSTWDTDTGIGVLKQGTTVPTFGIEKGFTDIGQYIEYVGCAVNTLAISISTDAIITGTLGIIGAGVANEPAYTSNPAVSSPTDPTYTEPFVSFDGEVSLGGDDACGLITGIDFTIDNGITANYTICTPEAASLTPDRFNVTGTLTMLFEDVEELNKFVDEDSSTLKITLTDDVGNELEFNFPKIKYTGGDVSVSGGGVIPISLPFQALYDTDSESTLVITRTPAESEDTDPPEGDGTEEGTEP
jgi:hypothetical protein